MYKFLRDHGKNKKGETIELGNAPRFAKYLVGIGVIAPVSEVRGSDVLPVEVPKKRRGRKKKA